MVESRCLDMHRLNSVVEEQTPTSPSSRTNLARRSCDAFVLRSGLDSPDSVKKNESFMSFFG